MVRRRVWRGRRVNVLSVVAGKQLLLAFDLREAEEDEHRAQQDRDDPRGVGPLVALQERGLGAGDDLVLAAADTARDRLGAVRTTS